MFSDLYVFQDLKSEKSRTQMGAARSILEKSTMMLLTTAKVEILCFLDFQSKNPFACSNIYWKKQIEMKK